MIHDFERIEESYDSGPDLVCLSHLRWNFVYQRPQHLMSRCAREHRVFYLEEPVFEAGRKKAALELRMDPCGVCVAVPRLPVLTPSRTNDALRRMVDHMFHKCSIRECMLWYYTPMAIPFTRHIEPILVVYDCMDELSGFRGAPPELHENEKELLSRSDLVFTGGMSLYEARAHQHPNIHPFPSSIDALHFARARDIQEIPADESRIPRPRIGFAGVIDERMDLQLVSELAGRRRDWSIILVGPVAKLNREELPIRPNIHYLGPKPYELLPSYMAGWDVAIMPFAHNESTRFISPTKTPEYLAAGRPVVSTSIRDVVRIYGARGLVTIADSPDDFAASIDLLLKQKPDPMWLERVDHFLSRTSWDRTWTRMMRLVQNSLGSRMGNNGEMKSSEPPTWQGTIVGGSDV